jgi:hypothetical protein
MATKEELENFYRENRIRQAQSVAPTVYDDPANAPTFFGSSLPIGQVERNLQAYGDRLTPTYNPTFRDKTQRNLTSAFDYLKSKGIMDKSVREGKSTTKDVATSFSGSEGEMGLLDFTPMGSLFAAQEGQRKIMEAEPDRFKRAMGTLSFMRQPLQTYLDRPKLAEGAFDVATGAVEAFGLGLLSRPLYKKIKPFADSLIKKLQGETSNVATKQEVGALPKVIANTKLKAPSMAMTDPKVVDEFGLYSEAERQAKMMQQNKGSGAQFAGFLLNKGVKQDELDATGLTDLFKNDNVTKKEIVDTIELNKVALIETKKTKQVGDGIDPDDYFATETFTDIRNGEEAFKSADEVKEAYDTGRYSRPTIEYDAMMYQFIGDDAYPIKLYGTINTHTPTGYKTVMFENLDDAAQDVTDIYFTFRPDADVKDWRNSVEAEEYANQINDRIREGTLVGQDKLASTKNLTKEDLADLIQDYTAQSFDEAVVRLKSATIQDGVYDPGSVAKWEGNTQEGGTNYKELLLRLPPKGDNKFGKIQLENPKVYDSSKDFRYRTHFDEFNPLFHIRTKDRLTNDGKKVLYVEELQSDWGQRGAGRGFKLEGDKLAAAKKELADARQELTDLKKGGVKLDGYEQETLYKLAYPNRPPIRIPFIEPKDFRAKHDNPSKYYDTEANVKDYEFDFSQSRMPEEFKTMTFGQYMNFIETMAQFRRGEISDKSLQYRKDTILDPQAAINKYYDGKDADFLFGQLNQSSFNADGNKFMKDLSNNYLKKYNAIQGGVPSAPFVTDRNKWTGLAIKRLIKLADEGGYDHVAFTPGAVQLDRWGKQSLVDYYDKIIPQVASKLPKSLGVTTEKITIPIKPEKDVGVAVTYDGRYFVRNDGSDKAIEGKFFKNEGDAFDYADMIRDSRTNQETFAINITPKMKETLRGGMPLFSTVGGMVGLGALGSMPSTQDGGT